MKITQLLTHGKKLIGLGDDGVPYEVKRLSNIPKELEKLLNRLTFVDGCWVWTGLKGNGYGLMKRNNRPERVHRLMYEMLVGKIPADRVMDHLCRNRACVNPRHLEVVSQQENILRGVGTAAINARKKECLRGHPFSGSNLKITGQGKRVCLICRNIRKKNRVRK